MNQKFSYVAPETEFILVSLEGHILVVSGVDAQGTTVSNPWSGGTEEEL